VSAAERAMGKLAARSGERALGLLALAAAIASVVLSLIVSPPDAEQGDLIRLMYVHVPSAWVAYLAFGVVFIASVAYLITTRTRWDRLAAASAEVGVLFTALTIVLGSVWARPVWGTWWTWDPRLTTTAIMLLIYVGYLAVRRLPDNPARRARWAAVVGIVGFVDVPIVHLSVRWWRSLHQAPARLIGVPDVAPAMGVALGIGFLAFTLLYLYLIALRLRVGRLEERVVAEALSPRVGQPAEVLMTEEDDRAASMPSEKPGEVPARG
jgi:heme exporter protein C